jgi:AraC-like DNA-binding protein
MAPSLGIMKRPPRGQRPFGAPPEDFGARILLHLSPWLPGHVPNVLLLTSARQRSKIDGLTPSALLVFFGRRGSVRIVVRGQRFEVPAGAAFVMQPYETFELEKDGDEFDSGGVVVVNETLLRAGIARAKEVRPGAVPWLDPAVAACGYTALGPAAVRFARRMVDAHGPEPVVEAMADFLWVTARARKPDLVIRRPPPPAPAFVTRIHEIVETEMPGRLLLADIAAEHGTTPAQLIRVFRRIKGVTPQQYLNGRRGNSLLYQLVEFKTLAAAAADTNYSDQAHMSRDFKARLGMRPGHVRRAVRFKL